MRRKPFRPEEPDFSVAFISPGEEGEVLVSLQSAAVAWHHAASHKEKEVAGLLLGQIENHSLPYFCRCDRAFPGRFCREERTSVTLTHRTWDDLSWRKERWAPHLEIVGWYHSHPDVGIFVSPDDKVSHQAAFGVEGSCALVIDPIRREWGAFIYRRGELLPASLMVFAPRKMRSDLRRLLRAILGEENP